MRVMSELDPFHLAQDAANAALGDAASALQRRWMKQSPSTMTTSRENGDDIPEVQNWKWENVNK